MKTLLDLAPVKFTPTAIKAIERIVELEKNTDQFLRIGAKSGGCAGFSYVMEFDSKTENDVLYAVGAVQCITDKSHIQYIGGMEIDYENGLNNRGFIYKNPNAQSTCGCGTSFS